MIVAAKYLIPVTFDNIEDGAMLVRDDMIADIGTLAELQKKYPDEEVRDYGRAALMPGFVDLHTHLECAALRGIVEEKPYAEWKRETSTREILFTPEDFDDSAMLGALEAVASGVTTVADITSTGSATKAANEIGLRGVFYREIYTMRADQVDNALQEGVAEVEHWRQDSDETRMSFGLAPGALYACHPQIFKGIADYACEHETPVALHVAGSQEEADFVRYGSSPFSVHATEQERGFGIDMPPWLAAGCTPVRYVYNWGIFSVPNVMAVHCVHVDDDDLDILKDNDVAIAYCPRTNAKLGMGAAPIHEFRHKKLRLGLGTDSPAATDTFDMIEEMRFGLLLSRALNPGSKNLLSAQDILSMATIDAARALFLDEWIGSLEVGKKADIIAVDLRNSHQNPIADPVSAVVYTANQDNIMMTMVNGKVLYDDFTHVSGVDRDKVAERVRALQPRLREAPSFEDLRAYRSQLADERAERLAR